MTDYYKTLGVTVKSSSDDIKRAYRKLSLKFHPDKNNGDSTMFKQINEAYQTLGTPDKKRMYDTQKNNPLSGMPTNSHDIFNMMFGGGMPFPHGGMPFPQGGGMPHIRIFHNGVPVNIQNVNKPAPIVKSIEITLEQAYIGINFPLKIEKWVMEENIRKVENETIYIDIKPGIDTDEIIILRNRGNIINGKNKGDVKLFIKIINNTPFKRDGLDLLLSKEIT